MPPRNQWVGCRNWCANSSGSCLQRRVGEGLGCKFPWFPLQLNKLKECMKEVINHIQQTEKRMEVVRISRNKVAHIPAILEVNGLCMIVFVQKNVGEMF